MMIRVRALRSSQITHLVDVGAQRGHVDALSLGSPSDK